ncbi:MAG: HAMP domain-containing protein [Acidobacteria bacterium]|nr:HAMP domain-containing protein [Acidobacteriota bacterium]
MLLGRKQSIATRLTLMNLLVSGVALLLACVGFFAYDQFAFREGLVRTLSAQAQIIGANSISAILFNDPQAAANTLTALKSFPNISSAGIYTADRRQLAEYLRAPDEGVLNIPQLAPGELEAHWFRSTHLVLVRRITSEGKLIGFVYLRADLREIDQRLRRYASISILVLLVSLLAAILVSAAFRRSVAKPIVELAATAQQISRNRDYTTRVPASSGSDEVSVLIDSFNDMLRELHKSHDELERRVAERTRELVSANRELEAFSYSVSHDLRSPLDAINGFSYLLLNQYADRLDQQTRELAENIRAGGKRMAELIDALLNLSRVTSSAIRPERVDLSGLARSIMQDLRRTAPQRKVEFIAPAKEEVFGDPRLLRVVMENLLRNAWKYTSRHNSARIEFGKQQNGEPVYYVKDDGSGFDPSSADRLFQPFQRLHSKSEFPGNGIGLATVKRIIDRHGGEVWAQGAVERGATVFFTIRSGQPGSGNRRGEFEKAEV